MLNVYTFHKTRPEGMIDLSLIPLNELATAVLDICNHQTNASLWFGYLDGWMLHPQEEVLIRRAIRKFDCSLVSFFPLSISHAWQNEINRLYTEEGNGDPNTNNNGSSLHDGSSFGHRHISQHTSLEHRDYQDRKARRTPSGRIQEGPYSSQSNNSSNTSPNNRIRS